MFLPQSMVPKVLEDIHQHELDHPGGVLQAQERALNDYNLARMDADITKHLLGC